jgi:MFS superfamily sulfate permease-like transporter
VKAILVAVILALLRFVRLVSRPKIEILGTVPGMRGLHSIDRHQDAVTIPGLSLFRFNAPSFSRLRFSSALSWMLSKPPDRA